MKRDHDRKRVWQLIGLLLLLVLLAAPVTVSGAPSTPVTEFKSMVTEDGFVTLLDGTLTGTDASLDKWVMAGPGAFVPYGDGEGFVTNGGMGMLWYPKDFGDAIFRIDYRDVRTAVTGYSNGGVMVGFPADYICSPLYPDSPACTYHVPYTERPEAWVYDWPGMPGPFPPAQTYANDWTLGHDNPVLGDIPTGMGNSCGRIRSARTSEPWVAVYCGNEVQINDSPDAPAYTGDPIKTGSLYNMRDLNATTGWGGSGAQARLDADVANGWVPGTPRAWHEMEIHKIGQQWTVFVDGVMVTQYDNAIPLQPKRAYDPPSSARQFVGSTLGLQNHGRNDYIEYKNVRVKEISAPPVNIVAPTIAGSGKIGKQLTATPGEWLNVTGNHPGHLYYEWFRSHDASQVIGDLPQTEVQQDDVLVGTEKWYTPVAEDAAPGMVLWVRVTMTTDQGTAFATAEATQLEP
jgi:hypothetical protein